MIAVITSLGPPLFFSYACALAFYQPWTVDGGIWSIRWSASHACCDSRLAAQLHPVDVTWTARADWCYCACAKTLLGEETTAEPAWALRTVNTSCSVYTLAGSQRFTQDVREATGTAWIGLEQNIIDTAVSEWRKRNSPCLFSHSWPTLQTVLLEAVAKWTTGWIVSHSVRNV